MRYTARALTLIGPALVALTSVSAQARTGPASDLRLLRCAKASNMVCVEISGALPADVLAATDTSLGPRRRVSWELGLGNGRFYGPTLHPNELVRPPVFLLVLLDVSGSMRGPGMAYTRAALRSFVSGLPPAAVRVAVVPFGSVHVERTIANGRFVTPEMASLQLEAIPAPSRSANTALYSAVQAGAALLARQQLRIRGSARRLLLLVTDGRNEVRPEVGDDKGLLTDDQLPLARTAAVQAGVEVIPFGVGVGVKRAQLDSLASPSGRAYISALEPLPIADELAAIRLRLSDYRRLTFASGADVATLGRIVRGDGLTVKVDGANGETIGLSWSPPLFALPVFEGTADTLATRGIGDEFALGLTALPVERLVYVMAVFLLLAVAWIVVPRWLWPPVAFEQSVVRERTEERLPSVSTVASAGGGLRSAREVPPRGPTQVTGEHPIAR